MIITTEIKLTDVAIIAATLLGPIFAVQVQKYLERWRDHRNGLLCHSRGNGKVPDECRSSRTAFLPYKAQAPA